MEGTAKQLKISITVEETMLEKLMQAQAKSMIFNRSEFVRKAVLEKIDNIIGAMAAPSIP